MVSLHRSSAKADWDMITPSKRNFFQKIAATTGGLVTPANGITVIGLVIVLASLLMFIRGGFWLGLFLLIVGRLLDIADGVVAEVTKTKSPLGELFDAVADKIGTFLTVVTLLVAEITNWWVVGALLLPQVVIMTIVFYKKQKGIRVHPTRPGKVSMALVWVGIPGLIVSKALGGLEPLMVAMYLVIIVSMLLGFYAAWQYATGRKQD